MQLGTFATDLPVMLAPMAGVTDLPMRQLAVKHGADIAIGEMMSSDLSLTHSRKSQSRAVHSAEAGLRSVQLVGNDPATIAKAAQFNVARGAQVIDINMGCPAKKVCKKAAGSALLADVQLVSDILESTVQAVSVPVTLKIRTGIDRDHRNGVDVAEIAQSCGISMLTVHGRTRADKFTGEAEYETLRDIVRAVDIPVIANGDITSVEKAERVLNYSGAAGVMIGRAAQGQLWLPGHIANGLRKGLDSPPCAAARLALVKEHCELLYEFHGPVMYRGGPRCRRRQAPRVPKRVKIGTVQHQYIGHSDHANFGNYLGVSNSVRTVSTVFGTTQPICAFLPKLSTFR
jgi:tRNA-dihydrouridine synthase B